VSERPLQPKRLTYDPHAELRMVERGFTDHDVRVILFTGVVSPAHTRYGAETRYGRMILLRGWPAKVIFLDRPDHYYIITVEWLYE
jgi:hypothetical protein